MPEPDVPRGQTVTAFTFLTVTSTSTTDKQTKNFAKEELKLSEYTPRNEHTFQPSYRPLTSVEARTTMAPPPNASKPASRALVVGIEGAQQYL
jgi:hypothetical protein